MLLAATLTSDTATLAAYGIRQRGSDVASRHPRAAAATLAAYDIQPAQVRCR